MDELGIAVVGGGIAGASVAYHLSEWTDREVVVYERGDLGGETTAKSAAFFGFYGTETERRMKRYGMELYNEFLADPRGDPRHDLVGRLRVATTEEGMESIGETSEEEILELSGRELRERVLCPDLDAEAIETARYRPHVGYHRPLELAGEFVARARENGATFEIGATVEDVLVEDGSGGKRVEGLVVDGESIAADAVVCATGPWNPHVAEFAGVELPAHHTLAPAMVLERESPATTALPIVTHVESGAYARDHGDDCVLVAHYPTDPDTDTRLDPGSVDGTVPADLRETMQEFLDEMLPGLADAPITEEWVGIRSGTPDGNPIVGWTDVAGFSIVAFHSSGIQLAPAAGCIVARQLLEGEPTEYHDAVSLARFEGRGERRFMLS